jgi:hypothetical protein
MRQPVVSPPESMQEYWKDEVIRNHPDRVSAYLKKHGLEKLPSPTYITPDTAIFYRQERGKWTSLEYPGQTHGLATAVENNWLMAPPVVETLEADTTVATGKSDLEVGLEQLADNLKKRDTREKNKINTFKCTVKGCTRRFKSDGGVKLHIRAKHQEDK